jgi:hypothetical protein
MPVSCSPSWFGGSYFQHCALIGGFCGGSRSGSFGGGSLTGGSSGSLGGSFTGGVLGGGGGSGGSSGSFTGGFFGRFGGSLTGGLSCARSSSSRDRRRSRISQSGDFGAAVKFPSQMINSNSYWRPFFAANRKRPILRVLHGMLKTSRYTDNRFYPQLIINKIG